MSNKTGFIGAGQMAQALGSGFVRAGIRQSEDLVAADVSQDALQRFAEVAPGSSAAATNADLCRDCDTVFLAVKPQFLAGVLAEIGTACDENTLVISIVAGVSLQQLEAALPQARVIRVMPNTPALVGAGASAYALGSRAVETDGQLAEQLLGSVGLCCRTREEALDAVTGLSGSGPAFVFMAIEALSDGGVQAGLPRALALQLAAQTVLGAAKLVLETGEHPAVLKDRVASPAGTTIAGIRRLEQSGFRGALLDAVDAAAERSRELGRSST